MGRFDKLSEQQASLQILIDQYNEADDYDERDEVLNDIAAHPSPQALPYLKLIAEQDDDPSTRCDAWCALHRRQPDEATHQALLAMLTAERPYELIKAAECLATASEAHPLSAEQSEALAATLWRVLRSPLVKEAQVSVLGVLETVDNALLVHADDILKTQTAPDKLDYDLVEGIVRTLALQPPAGASPILTAFREQVLALAKQYPDDEVLLSELGEFVNQSIQLLNTPADSEKDDDDDE